MFTRNKQALYDGTIYGLLISCHSFILLLLYKLNTAVSGKVLHLASQRLVDFTQDYT